jgi:hypothetical protein
MIKDRLGVVVWVFEIKPRHINMDAQPGIPAQSNAFQAKHCAAERYLVGQCHPSELGGRGMSGKDDDRRSAHHEPVTCSHAL